MELTDVEASRLLTAVGHKPGGVLSKTPEKHRYECSCGYVSTFRRTFDQAVEAGILHMRKAAKELRANGVSSPNSGARRNNVRLVR